MSCRSNAGSSAVTSFARAGSGLGDMQTLSMFHQQGREGASAEAPTPQALQDWQQNFRQQVQADPSIGDGQRQRILNRLDNLGDYTPDGPTFYAWQHMNDTARMGAANQNSLYSSIASATGRSYAEVQAEATNIEHQLRSQPERSTRLDPQAVLERARSLGRHSNNYLPQDQTSLAVYSRLLDEADAAAQASANDMQFQEVESSVIRRVGYNSANSTLEVQFNNGRAYQYQGVSPSIAQWLADPNISAGRLYNREIRGHFPSQEVTPTSVQNRAAGVQAEPNRASETATLATPSLTQAEPPTTRVSAPRCGNCGRFMSASGGHSCQSRARATREEQTAATVAAAAPLAQARAFSEEAQATTEALAAAQPPVVKYGEDMTAFQIAYDGAKLRKERGEPPVPFITENATGGLGARGSGRGFGVEIEFDMSHLGGSEASAARQRIGQELHAAGLTTTPRQEGYHSSTDYTRWRFEQDCTVDGEIISPIMYDTPEDWEKLQKVCEIVQRNGGKATTRTGGHVHVACGNYDHTPKNHNNLLKLVKKNEDLVYRLSANPARGKHRGTRWCSPNQLPARDFTSVDSVRQTYNSHGLGVNFQAVQGSASDHVEFRMYDGSLDPAVIQSQIKLSLGMTEAAFRASDGEVQAANPETLGKHKRDNQAQHGRRRITGEAWEADTASFREFTDTLFSREEDKAQMAALFAVTKWQTA